MSKIPAELYYAESHEWARLETDGIITVGISDHAQESLGEIISVDLKEIGQAIGAGEQVGSVESLKTASDIYAPVTGVIISVNHAVLDSPDLVNGDPYGQWLFKIEPNDPKDIHNLLDAEGYAKATGW